MPASFSQESFRLLIQNFKRIEVGLQCMDLLWIYTSVLLSTTHHLGWHLWLVLLESSYICSFKSHGSAQLAVPKGYHWVKYLNWTHSFCTQCWKLSIVVMCMLGSGCSNPILCHTCTNKHTQYTHTQYTHTHTQYTHTTHTHINTHTHSNIHTHVQIVQTETFNVGVRALSSAFSLFRWPPPQGSKAGGGRGWEMGEISILQNA